jgi:serine/threonine-protein kinase HipA
MELNVFVNKKKIGILKEIAPDPSGSNPNPRIQFEYLDNANNSDQVSLLMPVSEKKFIYHELPPVFDMILPEGKRRTTIAQVAKLTRVDDMGLLSIVGHNSIGRVQVCQGENIGSIPEINLQEFAQCSRGQELFEELLSRSGIKSGVAGVQPKVLASEIIEEPVMSKGSTGRTINTSTHIIKSFDPNEHPWLTVNEFFCLTAANRAGISTPKFSLSKDGMLLAVERFDLKDDQNGIHFGFEEILSLLGRKSSKKYEGSINEIINCIDTHIDIAKAMPAFKSIFRQTVFNTLIGNGDAHLKNFGLLYDDRSIFLSPTYDVVCTLPYVTNDMPALALEYDNYTKRWWSKEELSAFGERHCYMRRKEIDNIYNQITKALNSVILDIQHYIADHQEFKDVGNKMIDVWRSSMHNPSQGSDEEQTFELRL